MRLPSTPGDQAADPLEEYIRNLPALVARSRPSVFWERQLKAFWAYDPDQLDVAKLDRLPPEIHYGFDALPDGVATVREDPDLRRALEYRRRLRRATKLLHAVARDADKGLYEHARALGFLRSIDVLDEYLDFIEKLKVRSNMSVARHWYYASIWSRLASETIGSEPVDILEIGAGAANLACHLAASARVRSYCIIDLPEMLAYSALMVRRYAPQFRLAFQEDALAAVSEGAEGVFAFVPAEQAGDLASSSFDSALNFNSFMEMDKQQRDDYFELIYRTARPGALFFNVNRRQRSLPLRDGTTWDNNPLVYPYRGTDRVLVWEEDAFQMTTRAKPDSLPTLAIARAALI